MKKTTLDCSNTLKTSPEIGEILEKHTFVHFHIICAYLDLTYKLFLKKSAPNCNNTSKATPRIENTPKNRLLYCQILISQLKAMGHAGRVANLVPGYRFFSPYITFKIKINRSKFRK